MAVRDTLDVSGSLYTEGPLSVRVGEFLLAGRTTGVQGIAITGNLETTAGSALLSAGDIRLQGNQFLLSGLLSSDRTLTITGKQLATGDSAQSQAKDGMVLTATDGAQLAGVFTTLGDLGFSGAKVENRADISRNLIGVEQLVLQQDLNNATSGKLLSGGELKANAATVSNAGVWQGEQIILAVRQLGNTGTLQANKRLQLDLTGDLHSGVGSQIVTNGEAAITALALVNRGNWQAANLSLKGISETVIKIV